MISRYRYTLTLAAILVAAIALIVWRVSVAGDCDGDYVMTMTGWTCIEADQP